MLAFPAMAQKPPRESSIYYSGGVYTCSIFAPKDWILDLEDSRLDGYSAACYPIRQKYYQNNMIIYISIFNVDNVPFDRFISADSVRYIKKNEAVSFKKKDTLTICGDRQIRILENNDPGGKVKLTSVAYLDAGTELIVCELNISDRVHFVEAQSCLYEMLKKITLVKREE
jgi:hypothetical protein